MGSLTPDNLANTVLAQPTFGNLVQGTLSNGQPVVGVSTARRQFEMSVVMGSVQGLKLIGTIQNPTLGTGQSGLTLNRKRFCTRIHGAHRLSWRTPHRGVAGSFFPE